MRARLPPPGRTRPFPARSVESSSPPCPHATQPVRLLPYWDVSAIFVLPSPSDACAPLPAGEDRRRAPTRFVREARGATRVARASAEPACRPSLGPPPGPRGRRFGPPGSKRAVLTPPSGAFVDPTSSRSSVQKYLFTRSSPQESSAPLPRDWRQRTSEVHMRTTHQPVSDQRDCPPPPLALTAQDSVPQLATHSGGHCARRGCVAFLFCPLEGMFTLDAHGLLRFRTDDVLLGTSGVGVCDPSVMCYGYGPPVRRYRSTNIYSAEVGRWHLDGRVASGSKSAS